LRRIRSGSIDRSVSVSDIGADTLDEPALFVKIAGSISGVARCTVWFFDPIVRE